MNLIVFILAGFYRFLFTNNARMTSLVGDKFVAGLIGTLCDGLEAEYGIFVPRLYRIFKPLKGISANYLPWF
jgi:hypothetical protein